ncbi:SelB C-terminal domain-containing protein, partial [Brevibacterium epidermidis]|uniref:SelB domain-containing protein n=1 Tax=Brevibacterium epidermidis TaxID=1698 RepID=UPI001F53B811
AEAARRGAVERSALTRFGLHVPDDGSLPAEVEDVGGWLVHSPVLTSWVESTKSLVSSELAASPMAAGVPVKAVAEALRRTPDAGRRRTGETKRNASSKGKMRPALPEGTGPSIRTLVNAIISRAGLETADGMVRPPGHSAGLGAAEAGIAEIERRLAADPFAAPEAHDLRELGLGARELAVAEKAGRILRLGDGIIVSPRTPAQAMRILAGLDQPFTTSQARRALGTTRRVVIPLLEHLDGRGWTCRLDTTHREVVR